jgi:hypothetical protein
MINTKKTVLILFLLLFATAARGQITIDSHTTLLIDPHEPLPIQKAAQDLASDMASVFGTAPRVAHRPSEASANTICITFSANLPNAEMKPSGWEVLRIQEAPNPAAWPGSSAQHVLLLTGSDVRGVIYAIYDFAQRFLGVDPLYWWTDHAPARQTSVTVPAGFVETQGPTFHYRGWFMNDEDLMTGWAPGDAEGSGISLEVWDRVFEALLRLKGDMIIPNTFVFPYEPQVRAAGERGLIINQHHQEPLGLNTYQWPPDVPYTLERLEAAWKCAVSQYPKDLEIVWTVGLRGKYDHPFWLDMPDAPSTPEGRARMIQTAIEQEMNIVRTEWPDPHPPFIMNTWMEGIRMMRSGLLKMPEGVTLVWADDGAGSIMDGGLISEGEGVYYHTAVIGANSNHFTERVPPERIAHELGRAVKAGATAYLMLNPSDVRPVPMSTRAVMELAWNATPWVGPEEPSTYLDQWSREEFGEKASPQLAQYYRAYFAAPARYGDQEDETLGDNYYPNIIRDLLVRIITDNPESVARFNNNCQGAKSYPEYTRFLKKICQEAEPRWQKAQTLAAEAEPLVPPARRPFFQAHVLTEMDVHIHWNRALRDIASAAQPQTPAPERLADVRKSIPEIQAVLTAAEAADYGKWQGFHTRGDWFDDVPLTLDLARVCASKLAGNKLTAGQQETLKLGVHYIHDDTSSVYIRAKAYQKGQKVKFCAPGARN